jgi:hypothetical protein
VWPRRAAGGASLNAEPAAGAGPRAAKRAALKRQRELSQPSNVGNLPGRQVTTHGAPAARDAGQAVALDIRDLTILETGLWFYCAIDEPNCLGACNCCPGSGLSSAVPECPQLASVDWLIGRVAGTAGPTNRSRWASPLRGLREHP